MSKRFRLSMDPVIGEIAPTFTGLVLYVDGIVNSASDAWSNELLTRAEQCVAALPFPPAEHPHMQAWADVYRKFGARPKLYKNGCLALARRQSVPRINAVVDMYNAVAMTHMLPIGGEDWDQLESELVRTTARGHEVFLANDAEGLPEHPLRGEPVWLDKSGVTTRRFNWRQSRRTRITLATRAAYFVLDGVAPYVHSNVEGAARELTRLVLERWPLADTDMAAL
jgi:DNA/RNA-binding domain of Phe-tRNA-synthetase-like protein